MTVKRRPWSKKDHDFLIENYSHMKMEDLKQHLRRTIQSIQGRASILGLKRTDAYVQYAVYKGDDMLVMGSAFECAEELDMTEMYIRWLTTPSGQKRVNNAKDPSKVMTAIKID